MEAHRLAERVSLRLRPHDADPLRPLRRRAALRRDARADRRADAGLPGKKRYRGRPGDGGAVVAGTAERRAPHARRWPPAHGEHRLHLGRDAEVLGNRPYQQIPVYSAGTSARSILSRKRSMTTWSGRVRLSASVNSGEPLPTTITSDFSSTSSIESLRSDERWGICLLMYSLLAPTSRAIETLRS